MVLPLPPRNVTQIQRRTMQGYGLPGTSLLSSADHNTSGTNSWQQFPAADVPPSNFWGLSAKPTESSRDAAPTCSQQTERSRHK